MKTVIISTTLALFLLSGCTEVEQSSMKKDDISDVAKVDLATSKTNKIPVATFDKFSINRGVKYNGQLNATDADGDEIRYKIVKQPQHGSIVLQDNGCFTYISDGKYKGKDRFSYRASDDVSSCATKIVTVDVCDKPISKPIAPSDLKLEALSTSKVKISWNDNSENEDGFEIFIDGKLKRVKKANSTYTTVCRLKAGESYSIKVRAKNIAGVSQSIEKSITTKDVTTLPEAPTNLIVKSKDENSIRLSWKDNADNESSYEIYQDGVFLKSISSRCNCVLICNLDSCKDYNFEVKAKNKIGESTGVTVDVMTEGCVVPELDTTPPVITLNADPIVTIIQGNPYTDAGATAIDNIDGVIEVTTIGEVDTETIGIYTITYTATDSSGNSSSSTRDVKVVEPTTLQTKSPLPYSNCKGYILKQGKDQNANGLLDADEITSTENIYLEGTPLTLDELKQMIDDNEDVTNVNTCEITDMEELFLNNATFNQDISGWNVGSVTNMKDMFIGANSFNQPIGDWDVSNVTNMNGMFRFIYSFNQPIGNWDVSNVTNMGLMFYEARKFNQPLENWDVSNVTNMQYMFDRAESFNQPLENWNVSNVSLMNGMFHRAKVFNQPIGNWNVSNVTNMTHMFSFAISFNQPLENWDVSNVITMYRTFFSAISFNQPIGNWDVSNVTNMSQMFNNVTLSNANYNDILVKWANNLALQENVVFDAGNSKHDTSLQVINAKNYIINHFNWTITDGM